MPIETTEADAAADLARRLAEPTPDGDAGAEDDRPRLLKKFLSAKGFREAACPEAGACVCLRFGDDADDAAPKRVTFAVLLEDGEERAASCADAAAFAALAAARASVTGSCVDFIAVRSDVSGAQKHVRALLAAHPELKKTGLLLLPSPVRPFEMEGLQVFPMTAAFKGRARFKLTSKTDRRRASFPAADTAIAHLTQGLLRIANQQLPNLITNEAKRMFYGLRRAGAPALSLILMGAGPTLAGLTLENAFQESPLLPFLMAATRNTAAPLEILSAPPKAPGEVPDEASSALDIRLLPGCEPNKVMAELREILDDAALTLIPDAEVFARSSPVDSPRFEALMKAVAAQAMSARPVPWLSGEVPDTLLLGEACPAVYGLPLAGDPAGDELEAAAWKRSLAAIDTGLSA